MSRLRFHFGMQAQRVQTVGPEVGFIRSLAIDPTTPQTLYAGTSGDGVIKSTDGGTNWNAFNTGSKEMKGMSRDTNPSRVSN